MGVGLRFRVFGPVLAAVAVAVAVGVLAGSALTGVGESSGYDRFSAVDIAR